MVVKKLYGEWAGSDSESIGEDIEVVLKLGIARANNTLDMSMLTARQREAVGKALDSKPLTEREYAAAKSAISVLSSAIEDAEIEAERRKPYGVWAENEDIDFGMMTGVGAKLSLMYLNNQLDMSMLTAKAKELASKALDNQPLTVEEYAVAKEALAKLAESIQPGGSKGLLTVTPKRAYVSWAYLDGRDFSDADYVLAAYEQGLINEEISKLSKEERDLLKIAATDDGINNFRFTESEFKILAKTFEKLYEASKKRFGHEHG
jgi:hypothetical protein